LGWHEQQIIEETNGERLEFVEVDDEHLFIFFLFWCGW